MGLRKYEKYKDSGVPWIGKIPEHWEVIKFKFLFESSMGETILKTDLVPGGKIPVYSATESDAIFGFVNDATVILNKGDFVIPARGNSIGYVMLVPQRATCTQTTIYAKKKKTNFNEQYAYFFQIGFREHLFQFDRTAIPQLTVEQVKNNPFVVPPFPEQTAIAEYLDRKTAEIDALIEKKERLIKLYEEEKTAIINKAVTKGINPNVKMKDSGVPWIGEIPKHWKVKRLKFALRLITEKSSNDKNKIGLENIESNSGNFIKTETKFEGQGIAFKKEDILFGKLRPYLAKVYLAEFDGTAVGDFFVLRTNHDDLISRFAAYLLISKKVINELNNSTYGAKMPRVSWDFMCNFFIPLPPLPEQTAIVEYLDRKTAEINAKIKKIKKSIELLKEYRNTLISEVVTGKIKVV